ncbi:MAG: glutamine--fructose-6-phosphate transaminase (isomerizing) [Planctomycetes bacterium]|nr:glutamine--fructose-6-phosphate transaminase (isomerizing) [Planctomycetota bacterium]
MCGIMGYVGARDALPVVIEGLRRLEYRGYDSSGVAVWNGREFHWEKCPGKLEVLEDRLKRRPLPGSLGVGHTRWATHGGVTEINAHPHFSCDRRITLVHNGIIENYAELRRSLRRHRFTSDTDTEVIVHLVEEHYRGDPLGAVRAAARRLHGSFAIVVAFADHPDLLVGARRNAPLVVGLDHADTFIASDIAALLPHTRKVAPLQDGQLVVARRTGNGHADVRGVDLSGRPAPLHPITVPWALEEADKHGYPHFYLKEIFEQGQSLEAELQGRLDMKRGGVVFDGLSSDVKRVRRVAITACGSAWHAGLVAKYAIEALARLPVQLELASEMRYGDTPFDRGTLLLAISQSGETADTLEAVRLARRNGARTLAITNMKGSSISREAEDVLYMRAGLEIGVAASKTYTSQVMCGLLWAIQLGRWRRTLSADHARALLREARRVPDLVRRVLDRAGAVRRVAKRLADCKDYMYIGRRFNLATAFEGALKMKELSYLHAEGYGAGEMKHGPLAIVDDRLTTVAVVPRDGVYPKMVSNIQQIRSRGGRIVAVATEGDGNARGVADEVLAVPRVDELFSPLVTVVPLQLLAYHTAVRLKRDVDKPRNLAKSVTVE